MIKNKRSESDPAMTSMLKLHLLGNFFIELDDEPITGLSSRTAVAIFIYLVHHRHPIPRETLADFFWDERSQKQASANLRSALSRLRRHLPDYLIVSRDSVAFNHDLPCQVDSLTLEQELTGLLAKEEPDIVALEEIVTHYQGDFLAGFFIGESAGFDSWSSVQRERLRRLVSIALQKITAYHLANGTWLQGIAYAERWVNIDPLDELAHQNLMWLLLRAGRRHEALRKYEECRLLLQTELALDPSPVTENLFHRIQNLVFPPPLQLPTFPNSFVGRKQEIDQLIGQLAIGQQRLVTILGMGGTGKTRLSVQTASIIAQQNPGRFLDGIFYMPLAGLTSSDLLVTAIIAILGANPQNTQDPESYLIDYLTERELLLVMDNFEHLLNDDSRRLLKRMLDKVSGLKIIVTSRQRLGLAAETILDLSGLDYPKQADVDNVIEYGAVQLFLQQAQRLRPDFNPSPPEIAAIVNICHLVQGMPLGLELAASWTRLFDCAVIRDRIKQNIDLLDDGQLDEHGRPRAIRAIFEYTWQTLSTTEQQALQRMAVFRGPFSFSAVKYVTAAEPIFLQNLVDKSLLRHNNADLWSLHPLFQQYCAEQLAYHASEQHAALHRHAAHYLQLLEETAVSIRQSRQQGQRADEAIDRIKREIGNIRAMWERLCAAPEQLPKNQLIQFIDDFGLYLFHESWYQEAAIVYAQALTQTTLQPTVKGRWLGELARAYLGLGQPQKASDTFIEALGVLNQSIPPYGWRLKSGTLIQLLHQIRYRSLKSRQKNDDVQSQIELQAIQVYDQLSRTYYYAGHPHEFGFCALRSLNLAERANVPAAKARGYANLSLGLGFMQKHHMAQSYLERAHDVATTLNDAPSVAYTHLVTGVYDSMMGVWQRSDSSLLRATEIYLQLGDMQQWGEGFSVYCTNLYAQGRFQETADQRLVLVETARAVGNKLHESWGLSGLAAALFVLDRVNEAIPLLERSYANLQSLNSPQNILSAQALLGLAYLHQEKWQKALSLADSVMAMKEKSAQTFATNVVVFESVCSIYLRLLELSPEMIATLGLNQARLLEKSELVSTALVNFAKTAQMGQPRALICRALYLWLQGKEQSAFKLWRQAIEWAIKLNMPYDEARAQYELGRHLPNENEERPFLLQAAEQGFESMGAVYALRLVQKTRREMA